MKVIDLLQWLFDAGYGSWPRSLRSDASRPLLVGHRGVCGHPAIPENTLAAFDLAVGRGGGLEMDLHLTRDGVPVVHHDPGLGRVHGIDRELVELSEHELRTVAPQVPTLEEVLTRYQTSCPRFFLEPKVYEPISSLELLLNRVGALLTQYNLWHRTTLLSLDSRPLDAARAQLPSLEKVFVFGFSPRSALEYALRHGDTGLAGWYFSFPERARRFLTERNLHQGVGHIDYRNTLVATSNRGFEYQFTNRIDRLTN